ncbi:MAG: hypothetical protein E7032_00590 [Akkermansiaceae bacterium]|nr:hypothetical protein [Akkermansiaceae bacterium]
MKIKYCLVASAAIVVASCSSTDNTVVNNRASVVTKPQAAKPAQYLALPGQAAVAVGSADVDAAFDSQVSQYGGQPQTGAAMGAMMGQAAANTVAGALAPMQQTPTPMLPSATSTQPAYIHQTALPGQVAVGASPGLGMTPGVPGAGVPMNYSVRITNSTPGRIFVEAQDSAGSIYPCGFMEGGRSATTPLEQADPIAGPITIVVRDPDKDGAPEIRRFKVNPPAYYAGKTVGISIIPGGKYHASVDGNVYASGEAVTPPPTAVPQMTALAPMPTTPGGVMSYTVKITNTTPGRILVEARDAAGTEFPCGEMAGGASAVTPREQAAPIKGPITIIVRDPDKEGQPEIRRYKVNPPANYAGKTLGISIVPGGQYHADLDGQVYYTYTPPEAPPTTNPQPQPVAPAAPAAPAPGAPAPAATPAGI